ncbi:MAG: SLATT domain-containing protein [Pyrinomonadaceae bacterium]
MIDQKTLVTQWLNGLSVLHRGHFTAAKACEQKNIYLGIPVIVLSTIVGSAVFASIQTDSATNTKIMVGALSIMAAIFSGLQTFLKFSERAERHKITATKYGILRRELEQSIVLTSDGIPEKAFLDSLRTRWDSLDEESPTLPARIWTSKMAEISKPKVTS